MITVNYQILKGFSKTLGELEELLKSYPVNIEGLTDFVNVLIAKINELQRELNIVLVYSSRSSDGRLRGVVGICQKSITNILTRVGEIRQIDEKTLREEHGAAIQLILGELNVIKKELKEMRLKVLFIFPPQEESEIKKKYIVRTEKRFDNMYERLSTLRSAIDKTIWEITETNSPKAHKALKGALKGSYEARINDNLRILYYITKDKENRKVFILFDITTHDVINSPSNASRYSESAFYSK